MDLEVVKQHEMKFGAHGKRKGNEVTDDDVSVTAATYKEKS